VERIVAFGKHASMPGILSLPDGQTVPDVAVIIANAGMLHRVGPYRLHVTLARSLAETGFRTLRLDLSGIGDADTRTDTPSEHDRAMADLRESMDCLTQKHAVERFILAGMCTGAVNAHHAAVSDDRVAGVVCLDGYAYPTPASRRRRCTLALSHPRKTLRVAAQRARDAGPTVEDAADDESAFGWELPPKDTFVRELEVLTKRGCSMLYVFSGGTWSYYNYREQFVDGLPDVDFRGCLELEYFGDADHVYTLTGSRDRLQERICTWVNAKFGAVT
jgi:dienelactone hydrolase